MYLVRDPHLEVGDDSHYREGEDRSEAYARASMIRICTRCHRDLERHPEMLEGDRQAVIEYPSANRDSEDVYLAVVCWDCVPDVIEAVRQADELRTRDAVDASVTSSSWLDPIVEDERAAHAAQGISDDLLSAAADAVEQFGEDELERFAAGECPECRFLNGIHGAWCPRKPA